MAKNMTLDTLAALIQGEFSSLREEMATMRNEMVAMRGEMATKRELRDLKEELLETLASKDDLKGLAANWAGEIISLQQIVKDLQTRVAALESKRARK